MKSKLTAICCLLTCICLPVLAQGTAFTYQGRLNDGVSPANGSYDLRFAVYDAAGAGTPQGNLLTNTATGVTNGLFTVTLDFGAGPFSNGAPRWLDIAARTNNAGPFTQMNPRQPLTATPYAIYAGGAATVAANSVGNSQLASGAVTSDKLADGSITALDVDSVSFSNTFWKVDGNAGTPFSTSFLGTTDFRPLDFRVNNLRALHLDANDSTSPNVIGGHANNISTAFGAFIGGGGNASAPQRIEGAYSAIVSGWGNTNAGLSGSIGGGVRNLIDSPASSAFIAAGLDNHIGAANYTAIGGGQLNRIQTGASWSLIGGGVLNLIQSNATAAVIAGGDSNTNAGNWAVVAGGRANTASADYAFAAGRRAQASHPGAFVWADSQNADFGSSGANQFLIRAAGGVGINTTQPVSALQVSGTVTADNFSGAYSGDGGGLVNVNAAALGGLAVSNLWQLGGNAGTTPGSQFLGTSDAQALELKVNGRRALRLEPTLVNSTHSNIVNVVGGSAVNVAANGVYGATVSGGGAENYLGVAYTNSVSANFGTVAGGLGNLSAGLHSAVGGGFGNTAAGFAATAPGGSHNQARGDFSFAAGNNALATNSGAYVWADSQVAPFGSTAGDQYCIRAQGGVQLNTDTSLFFGSQVRQMINLWGNQYGVGVQSGTTYFRTTTRFSWFSGGSHSDTQNDPGPGGTVLMTLSSSGLTVNGTFVSISDRNAKENFKPVNPHEVLDKVAALPLNEWTYKNDAEHTRHVGPMAQDFYAAFNVGADDKHIAVVDEGGVALAAIQGLNQKVEEKDARIQAQESRIWKQAAEITNLKQQAETLERRLENLEQLIRSRIEKN